MWRYRPQPRPGPVLSDNVFRPPSRKATSLINACRTERGANRGGVHPSIRFDDRGTTMGRPIMKRWPIGLIVLGGVILIPGGVWFSTSGARLTKNDDAI